jgi:aminoglycoside phosphotransferase (APT) family kinase protein
VTEETNLEAHTAAVSAVAQEFGELATTLVPKAGGLTNHVFEAHLPSDKIIVRLSSSPNQVAIFQAERLALEIAKDAGIPTPKVYGVGEVGEWGYMVAQLLPGEPAMHHPRRLQILEDLARLAARIHMIPMQGFGGTSCGSADVAKSRSWKSWFLGEFKAHARLSSLVQNQMLSVHQHETLAETLEAVANWDGPPVLNHGDLRLKNVVVDADGAILGLIDWDCSLSSIGSYWDLSIALHDLSIDGKEVFLKAYGLSPDTIREAAPVWRLFNILNYSSIVEEAVSKNDAVALDWLRTRFGGALELYVQV